MVEARPTHDLVALEQFLLQLLQLNLVLAQQSTLVDVFINESFVFDVLGSGCKLQGLVRLVEGVRRR